MKYYWLDIETYLFWSIILNKAYTSKVHYEVKKEPNVDKFIVVLFLKKQYPNHDIWFEKPLGNCCADHISLKPSLDDKLEQLCVCVDNTRLKIGDEHELH